MKSGFYVLLIFAITHSHNGFSQEEKKPVAENDFATARVQQTIEIMVLENDFAFDGHPFKVRTVLDAIFGTIVKTDSSIFYTPGFGAPFQSSVDTIKYNILDMENNLISDMASVYVEVANDGFANLDINEVNCRINAYGMQYWDMYEGAYNVKYEVPAGSGITSIFNQALWIGGRDEFGNLHLAAERYRIGGPDFYSGPVMDSLSYTEEQDIKWHKVWKLSKEELSYHLQHWHDAGYEPVENIQLWPGTGDTSLGQSLFLAPYYDQDGDDKYDPLKGDCPVIKGDQAIFVLNNDDRGPHIETGGKKMGVEIQTLYYAFDAPEDSALKYTTFADQRIINRSDHTYHDVYAGQFLDFDLGYYLDDFLLCDTLLQSAICYNGEPVDGNGDEGEYGEHPPAQAITALNYNLAGFGYFFNYGVPSAMLDPSSAKEYYQYLRGYWRDSTHITYGDDGYGGEQDVNYIFTGDPVSGTGWTEYDSPYGPGDRRGLVTSGPYEIGPGDTIHLEYALVFARDFTGDHLASLALLKDRIHNVRDFYQDFLGIGEILPDQPQIELYPNPCINGLNVAFSKQDNPEPMEYFVYDMLGRQMKSGLISTGQHTWINTGDLAPGLYLLRFQTGKAQVVKKFIRKDEGN